MTARVAVIGAGGRTGRRCVEALRRRGLAPRAVVRGAARFATLDSGSTGADREDVATADATDAEALARALSGCDAVICAYGPGARSAPDEPLRVARALESAMRVAGISRLAIVTGAMCGEPEHLGWFYRRMVSARGLEALLASRRAGETLLRESGLDVTVLRPPRLTDAPPRGRRLTLDVAPVIRMGDVCTRAHLAEALVEAAIAGTRPVKPADADARDADTSLPVTDEAGNVTAGAPRSQTLFVRSVRDDARLLRAWLFRCALAEMAGIALAAAVASAVMPWADGPGSPRWAPFAALVAMTAVGGIEGAFLGFAQGSILHDRLPRVPLRRFVRATAAATAGLWALGMTPSLLRSGAVDTREAVPQGVVEPPLGLMLTLCAVGGALGGVVIGLAQRWALGPRLRRKDERDGMRRPDEARRWVAATAAGWAIGLPIDVLGASLPDATRAPWLVVASAAGFGLLAGVAFALPTGMVARTLGQR